MLLTIKHQKAHYESQLSRSAWTLYVNFNNNPVNSRTTDL